MREKRLRKITKTIFAVVAILIAFQITSTKVFAAKDKTIQNAENTTDNAIVRLADNDQNEGQSEKKALKKSETKGVGDILKAATTWINGAEKTENTEVDDFVNQFVGIGQLLVIAGVIVILITIGITGIRWITASPDKQAKLKEQLIGLVIATVVIFGAVGIWNLVRGIMMKVEDDYLTTGNSETIIVADNQIK